MKDVKVLELKNVVIDYRTRSWCKLKYPDHPKGCPNFGKKEICPPQSPLFEQVVKPPYTLVAVKFNLEKHAKEMKKRHPNWSDKQARCVLYWQGKLDKKLREVSEKVASKITNSKIVYKPESYGVHVFETCRKLGFILERNPQKILWKITIIGIEK
ncbi:MAG: hypothetical protein ACXACX_09325 [Candidatus Hodarchaeales archaeon]|jgi:hypothetical protein